MSFKKLLQTASTIQFAHPTCRLPKSVDQRRTMVSASLPESPILFYDLQPSPGGCPYAQRAKITVKEKGIPIDLRLIDPENKPAEFVDLFRSITSNPNGRGTVPTIIDGDIKLTESHVVSEYLDTKYAEAGTKLFPTDASDLAKVKLFVELFTSEVNPSGFKILTADSQEIVDEGKETLIKGVKVLDSFLKDHGRDDGDYLLGKDFSYAEVATIPFIHRYNVALAHFHSVHLQDIIADNALHRFDRWFKAGDGRPAVKETMISDEDLIKGFSKFVKPPFKK